MATKAQLEAQIERLTAEVEAQEDLALDKDREIMLAHADAMDVAVETASAQVDLMRNVAPALREAVNARCDAVSAQRRLSRLMADAEF